MCEPGTLDCPGSKTVHIEYTDEECVLARQHLNQLIGFFSATDDPGRKAMKRWLITHAQKFDTEDEE